MGTIECSQPASKSSWDSQDFGDISMVLKMAHFRKSTGPRWVKQNSLVALNMLISYFLPWACLILSTPLCKSNDTFSIFDFPPYFELLKFPANMGIKNRSIDKHIPYISVKSIAALSFDCSLKIAISWFFDCGQWSVVSAPSRLPAIVKAWGGHVDHYRIVE